MFFFPQSFNRWKMLLKYKYFHLKISGLRISVPFTAFWLMNVAHFSLTKILRYQFHQHFTPFLYQSVLQVFSSYGLTLKYFIRRILKKAARKMLMKLTKGLSDWFQRICRENESDDVSIETYKNLARLFLNNFLKSFKLLD